MKNEKKEEAIKEEYEKEKKGKGKRAFFEFLTSLLRFFLSGS